MRVRTGAFAMASVVGLLAYLLLTVLVLGWVLMLCAGGLWHELDIGEPLSYRSSVIVATPVTLALGLLRRT